MKAEYLEFNEVSRTIQTIQKLRERSQPHLEKFCKAEALHDLECFEYGTRTANKRYADVWAILDQDGDEKFTKKELQNLYNDMDMDLMRKNEPSLVEVTAFFSRNSYIVCRPMRTAILDDARKLKLKVTRDFMKFLDADDNKKIELGDAGTRILASDSNGDSGLDIAEWNDTTG